MDLPRILALAAAVTLLPTFASARPAMPIDEWNHLEVAEPPPPPPPQPIRIARTPPPPPKKPKKPFERSRNYLGVAYTLGAIPFGDVSGFAIGGQLMVGRHFGRFDVLASYTLLNAGASANYDSDEPTPRGMFQRGGADFLYHFGRIGGTKKRSRIQQSFNVGAGVGMQRMRWFDGGRLTRPDVSLSLSSRTAFRIGEWKTAKVGYLDMGLRSFIARGPKSKDMGVTCAGPCDEPTGPFRYDIGIMWMMGFSYGR